MGTAGPHAGGQVTHVLHQHLVANTFIDTGAGSGDAPAETPRFGVTSPALLRARGLPGGEGARRRRRKVPCQLQHQMPAVCQHLSCARGLTGSSGKAPVHPLAGVVPRGVSTSPTLTPCSPFPHGGAGGSSCSLAQGGAGLGCRGEDQQRRHHRGSRQGPEGAEVGHCWGGHQGVSLWGCRGRARDVTSSWLRVLAGRERRR